MEMVSLRAVDMKDPMNDNEIMALCQGYTGDTVFALSDAITAMNTPLALDIVKRISTISRVDEWWG
jgi:hypothetical protein